MAQLVRSALPELPSIRGSVPAHHDLGQAPDPIRIAVFRDGGRTERVAAAGMVASLQSDGASTIGLSPTIRPPDVGTHHFGSIVARRATDGGPLSVQLDNAPQLSAQHLRIEPAAARLRVLT